MEARLRLAGRVLGVLAVSCAPAFATVQILSMAPAAKSPQPIGTTIAWGVKATDSNAGPLAFQFNIAHPGQPLTLVKDFNAGQLSSGIWKPATGFSWTPTGVEGVYQIQVVVKDFASGETASKTVRFQVTPLVTGETPVAVATSHPLVALFSTPACPAGSSMRVSFRPQSDSVPATVTNWVTCHPPRTMTFEIAGMYPATTYRMFSQTLTGGKITNSAPVAFTTGSLPTNISFPTYQVLVPPGTNTDTTDSVLVYSMGRATRFPDVATDLAGNILWYYHNPFARDLLTRPLAGGKFLAIEDGPAWNPGSQLSQFLREIDFAGNILHETNTGIIQQQLLAMGAIDGGPCTAIAKPAPLGSACLGSFHHDAIGTLPGGYVAVIADIEKIFPAGTQGVSGSLPVDIVGDMIIVLNADWQVAWYFDAFQHAGGAPQLDINRAAVLGETCVVNQGGCPPIFLLGRGIASKAQDWLHANSVYYWPQSGDLVWSARHQDWIMKVDYGHGSGGGDILWRMGLDGDFTFNNINNDPWPWFSHQHEAGIENLGAGPLTVFDNGNTRVSAPPLGLGSGNSRGMSLAFDETTMQVTPDLSVDLGVYSFALGSAQLLSDGNYFFLAGQVVINLHSAHSYAVQTLPGGGFVFENEGPDAYRTWEMPSLYDPPAT